MREGTGVLTQAPLGNGGFFGIADAREVEAEVVKLRRSLAEAPAT